MNVMLLDVNNVKKMPGRGLNAITALNGIPLNVDRGEFIAIMDESGSGRFTLFNLIATYDKATEGAITIGAQNIRQLRNKEIAHFCRDHLGFVFQDFNILPTTTNKDSILVLLVPANHSHQTVRHRLYRLSYQLHIEPLLNKYLSEISGGEQQRVAICRVLIDEPDLLLADEPTGTPDPETSKMIMELFRGINKNEQTILMVTHSAVDASYAKRILFIRNGRLYHEIYHGEELQSEFQKRTVDNLIVLHESGG